MHHEDLFRMIYNDVNKYETQFTRQFGIQFHWRQNVSVQLNGIELNHFYLHHENGDTEIDERQRIQ